MNILFKLFIPFLFCVSFAGAQQITDLKDKIQNSKDTEKSTLYLQLGKLFSEKYGRADSMLFFSQKALSIAEHHGNLNEINRSKLAVAIALQRENFHDTSNIIIGEILKNKEIGKELLGDIYFTIGLNHYRMNRNKEALDNYLRSVEEYSSSQNIDGLAHAYCRMSALFINENQLNEALDNASKTEALLNRVKDPFTKLTILSGLSGIYVQIGIKKKNYLDTAIALSKKALDLVVKEEFYSKANQLCNAVSNAYYLKRDSVMALEYCKRSLKFREYLLPNEIVISYLNLSDCYNRLQQHNNSLTYLDSVAILLPSINDPYYQMSLFERKFQYNKDAGNLKEALHGLERFKVIQDSLYTLEKNTAINDLMQKYDKVENEKKISELNKENEIASLNVKILIIGMLAAVLAIVIIIFFYRQSVLKNKFKVLETEQRLNRARMDPHFFFNALSSIQTLSMDEANSERVPSLISKFSKIMRQSLESTYDELTTIEEEILFLTNYLEIQKLRFNNRFDYEIKADEVLLADELKIPGMLLQPFIENAIEHGFKNINYRGEIKVGFSKIGEEIKIELTDNGKGFNTGKQDKEYPSRATQIISERLLLLNKKERSNARYTIGKNPETKGILVEVFLPEIT